MNRTIRSLVAATAATAALSLITLAAASTSAAARPAASPLTASSTTKSLVWAGYVDTMNHPGGYNRFKSVQATFKVPAINCSKSIVVGHPWPARYPGHKYWSAAGFWVGLDGGENDTANLEQTGITGYCTGPKAAAQYEAWYQMDPQLYVIIPLKDAKSHQGTMRVGDTIHVQVWDTAGVDPRSPKWANLKYAGYIYSVGIQDTTRGISYYSNGLKPRTNGYGRAPDMTAEVITEAVSGGPYSTAKYTIGLAKMGTVNYTDVYVSSFATGWIYGINMHSNWVWSASKYSVNQPRTLIGVTALGGSAANAGSSSPFSTYWDAK